MFVTIKFAVVMMCCAGLAFIAGSYIALIP